MNYFPNENSNLYFSKLNMQDHEMKDIVAGATFKYYSILNQVQVELSHVNGENSLTHSHPVTAVNKTTSLGTLPKLTE